MDRAFRRIFTNGLFIGMASVFLPPFGIQHKMVAENENEDTLNISNDWKTVGSYIYNAYGANK